MLSWLDTFDMEGKLLQQLEGIKTSARASMGKGLFSGACIHVCIYSNTKESDQHNEHQNHSFLHQNHTSLHLLNDKGVGPA